MFKKIAIQVVSQSKSHAYDRRRAYPFLAKMYSDGLIIFDGYDNLKTIDPNAYELIIINISSDLPFALEFLQRPRKPLVILDFCDFIHVGNNLNFMIKSVFALLRRRYSRMMFKSDIIKLFQLVDGIVVGSDFQKRTLQPFNKNISVIPDILTEIPLRKMEVLNRKKGVLWEGFADSNFAIFRKLFKYWSKVGMNIPLYIITDNVYHFAGGIVGKVKTKTLFSFLNRIYPVSSWYVKEWNLNNLVYYSEKCSLAIIPISSNIITRYKPENKILIMIRLGLYPIVSDIPAYRDFEKKYKLKICFSSFYEFKNLVEESEAYRAALISVREQILADYSEEVLMVKWKAALSI